MGFCGVRVSQLPKNRAIKTNALSGNFLSKVTCPMEAAVIALFCSTSTLSMRSRPRENFPVLLAQIWGPVVWCASLRQLGKSVGKHACERSSVQYLVRLFYQNVLRPRAGMIA